MSIDAVVAVFKHSAAKGNERLVLLCIADEADDEGRNAFPSIRRIAMKANCHPDTVIECVKALELMGELEVKRPLKQGRGHFNKYKVLLGNLGMSDPSETRKGRMDGAKRSDEAPEKVGPIRTNPSTDPSTNPRNENVEEEKVFDAQKWREAKQALRKEKSA